MARAYPARSATRRAGQMQRDRVMENFAPASSAAGGDGCRGARPRIDRSRRGQLRAAAHPGNLRAPDRTHRPHWARRRGHHARRRRVSSASFSTSNASPSSGSRLASCRSEADLKKRRLEATKEAFRERIAAGGLDDSRELIESLTRGVRHPRPRRGRNRHRERAVRDSPAGCRSAGRSH